VYTFLILLHFVVKDNIFPLSILYYISPIPLIIVFGIIITFTLIHEKKQRYASIMLLLVLTTYWFYNFRGKTSSNFDSQTKQIAFWNIADQKHMPRSVFEEQMIANNPELIALAESKNLSFSNLKYISELLPDYDIRILKGYMLIAVKGDIVSTNFSILKTKSKFNHIVYKNNNNQFSVVFADVSANPFQNRKSDLEAILAYSKNNNVDIILGDFNTPFESTHFKNYKNDYSSFHSVSKGFTATWPLGIPLLELDQIWINKSFEPILLNKHYNSSSDHALLIGHYRLLQN